MRNQSAFQFCTRFRVPGSPCLLNVNSLFQKSVQWCHSLSKMGYPASPKRAHAHEATNLSLIISGIWHVDYGSNLFRVCQQHILSTDRTQIPHIFREKYALFRAQINILFTQYFEQFQQVSFVLLRTVAADYQIITVVSNKAFSSLQFLSACCVCVFTTLSLGILTTGGRISRHVAVHRISSTISWVLIHNWSVFKQYASAS